MHCFVAFIVTALFVHSTFDVAAVSHLILEGSEFSRYLSKDTLSQSEIENYMEMHIQTSQCTINDPLSCTHTQNKSLQE